MAIESEPTRRGVLWAFVWATFASIAGTLTAAAGRFLRGPGGSLQGGRSLEVGPVERFQTATQPVEALVEMAERDGYFTAVARLRVFLVSDGGVISALSSTCTHLGCTVAWEPGSNLFRCPCHGGRYRRDGTVAGGPPPGPLARLPVEIREGKVYVRIEEPA